MPMCAIFGGQQTTKEDRGMEQNNITEDNRKGKHLTHNDRITIEAMSRRGIPPRDIASIVRKSRRTIERELVRGRVIHLDTELREKEVYSSDRGQDVYDLNATAKGKNLKLGSNREMVKFISTRIVHHRESPDVVAFRMKKMEMTDCVCTKTIYSYIDMGLIDGVSNETLLEKRNRRKQKKHKIRRSPKRLAKGDSIENRPDHIDNREEFGNWEMDLVVGPRKGGGAALLTIVERKTRNLITRRIPDKTQESVLQAIKLIEREYGFIDFRRIFKTITVDNGSEFLDVDAIEKSAFSDRKRTKVYYAHPYSSWERGSNENTNRIIRRFIAKGNKISKYTKTKIKDVEQWINQYPRRILEFASPYELFTKELSILG